MGTVRADKLAGFSYANGIHWCDTSVYNGGYYKRLALVKNSGIIQWDVKKENLPDEIVRRIEADAERTKAQFMAKWEALSEITKYQRILDSLTIQELLTVKRGTPMTETIERFESTYFLRC